MKHKLIVFYDLNDLIIINDCIVHYKKVEFIAML